MSCAVTAGVERVYHRPLASGMCAKASGDACDRGVYRIANSLLLFAQPVFHKCPIHTTREAS